MLVGVDNNTYCDYYLVELARISRTGDTSDGLLQCSLKSGFLEKGEIHEAKAR